jgi:hypothetical protein
MFTDRGGETVRETAQHPRAAIPLPASLAIDPDRLERIWAMTPAQRRQAAERGQLPLGEMLKWASRLPHEVPTVNGEWFFLAAYLTDNVEGEDGNMWWQRTEASSDTSPTSSGAAARDTSRQGRR